jgi:hypothetical protein
MQSWYGSRPVVGRVAGRSVRLRKRIGYRNSFQTFLTGTLEPRGEGTAFRARAGMHPFVAAFMAVWFAAILLIGGPVFVAAVRGVAAEANGLVGLLAPPLMLVCGLLLVWFGRYLARGEEQFLVSFVAEVLGARGEAEAEAGAGGDPPRG